MPFCVGVGVRVLFVDTFGEFVVEIGGVDCLE